MKIIIKIKVLRYKNRTKECKNDQAYYSKKVNNNKLPVPSLLTRCSDPLAPSSQKTKRFFGSDSSDVGFKSRRTALKTKLSIDLFTSTPGKIKKVFFNMLTKLIVFNVVSFTVVHYFFPFL